MLTVPRRCIEELIREFGELKAMWATFDRKHPQARTGREVRHG
jgi:hypothetical protein